MTTMVAQGLRQRQDTKLTHILIATPLRENGVKRRALYATSQIVS